MLWLNGRPAISQLWWLNTGGEKRGEGRLEQYFTPLDPLDATVEPCESVRVRQFPKNSCNLSDFLIRLDSWLYCTAFGRATAMLKYCALKTVEGLPGVLQVHVLLTPVCVRVCSVIMPCKNACRWLWNTFVSVFFNSIVCRDNQKHCLTVNHNIPCTIYRYLQKKKKISRVTVKCQSGKHTCEFKKSYPVSLDLCDFQ